MIDLFTHPTRALTSSGAGVLKAVSYESNDPVELAPSYIGHEDWRKHIDKARGSDARDYLVRIHPSVEIKATSRSLCLPDVIRREVASRTLSDANVLVGGMPGSGKSTLSVDAASIGLPVLDSDALLFALMDRPFGFPTMTRKQHSALTHDQVLMLLSLALAPKVPRKHALFVTNLTSGIALRTTLLFARSYSPFPVVSFLVLQPPEVLHARFSARETVKDDYKKSSERKAKIDSFDLKTFQKWDANLRKSVAESYDYDFIIEVPNLGDDTLYLSDVFATNVITTEA